MNFQVIIIEDDPMVAAIDRQYVEMDSAFQVSHVFKSGGEALDYLLSGKERVDLIILDYYTPSITGMEFVDRLHAMGKTPAIIMVTSANDTQIVQGLLSRGVLDYLVKPFQYSRFHQALSRFVQSQKLLEDGGISIDQRTIDQLLQHRDPSLSDGPLAKGLNAGTLEVIRHFFSTHPNQLFTGEEIAAQVKLSRITIRRYVNYMADAGEIASSIDYQTGGRPAIRYSLKSILS